MRAAATHEKTGGPNFTAGEGYKTAMATAGKPNLAMTFIDTKPLFERTYTTLKPLAMFGAAFAGPQLNDFIDLGKLPDGEAVAKHLSPIILSEKSDDQGILVESVGPVTFIQASAGLGVIAGAAAAPMLQQRLGEAAAAHHLPDAPTGGSPDGNDAPDSKPAGSPQPAPGQ